MTENMPLFFKIKNDHINIAYVIGFRREKCKIHIDLTTYNTVYSFSNEEEAILYHEMLVKYITEKKKTKKRLDKSKNIW